VGADFVGERIQNRGEKTVQPDQSQPIAVPQPHLLLRPVAQVNNPLAHENVFVPNPFARRESGLQNQQQADQETDHRVF